MAAPRLTTMSAQQENDKENATSSTLAISQAFQAQNISGQSKHRTLYEILGVAIDATEQQIKTSYRRLAKIHHPDRGGDAAKFKEIEHACHVLSDKETRSEYDSVMNNPDAEKKYCKESYESFCDLMFKALDLLSDQFNIRAEKDKDKKSCIILHEDPVFKHWGAAYSGCTQGKIFYIVGNPIRFSDEPRKFRKTIPAAEIINSSKTQENNLKLFSSEFDALQYSRATRVGNFYAEPNCLQSPIIEVKLLIDLNNNFELKNLSAFVNDRFEGHGYVFNESNIFYIEIEASHIEKMTIRLNVQTVIGDRNYPTVNLATEEETIENTKSSFCRLQ